MGKIEAQKKQQKNAKKKNHQFKEHCFIEKKEKIK